MSRCPRPPHRYKGYRIVYTKEMPDKRLGGLNCYAARDRAWNLPYPYPCSTILIDPKQSCKVISDTIRHEYIELNIMKDMGLPYPKAHRFTEKIEKITK